MRKKARTRVRVAQRRPRAGAAPRHLVNLRHGPAAVNHVEASFVDNGQTASNRTPRQINRDVVFNHIRARQPISRADLARISGLQRSTISNIVEELLAEEWVIECPMEEPTRRGRKPIYLTVNSRLAVVAVDIHPSQITIAIADLSGRIMDESRLTLPEASEQVMSAIVAAVQECIASHVNYNLLGIGVALPGRFSHQLDQAIFAPNVAWPIAAIKSTLEKSIGLPVAIDNVANACALSEVWLGSDRGYRDLVAVNVSEGIGTGIYANGRLLRGAREGAGEFGHIQLDHEGIRCNCGSRGCWETLGSNRAAMRYYEEMTGRAVSTFDALLALAQHNDEAALVAIQRMGRALGQGMHMIVCAVAPSEIVVVGELTGWWDFIGPIIEAELRSFPLILVPTLRIPTDPERARLRSAVALIMNERSWLA
jgi:predicted NBD/HSP70 family sugar kinase